MMSLKLGDIVQDIHDKTRYGRIIRSDITSLEPEFVVVVAWSGANKPSLHWAYNLTIIDDPLTIAMLTLGNI